MRNWRQALALGAPLIAATGFTIYWYITKRKKKDKAIKLQKISKMTSAQNETPTEGAESDRNDNNNYNNSNLEIMDTEDVSNLSLQKRDELALAAKNRGNKYYSGQKYLKAIELYTKAIALCPNGDTKCAVYYSNRAACYANMGEFLEVIADCTTALNIDPGYLKAVLRRASAFEKIGKDQEALNDFTFACFLEEFRNRTSVDAADRVLKRFAAAKAREIFATGNAPQTLPSLSFCTAYLGSFRFNYSEFIPIAIKSNADEKFKKAVLAYGQKDWDLAMEYCKKCMDDDLSAEFKGAAFNMRGTFLFLMGRPEEAYIDYERSLDYRPDCSNTCIKMACLMMEKDIGQDIEKALHWFERALKLDGKNPDVFYHRGQVYFLIQDYENALKNYETSIKIDPEFQFAYIQRAVSLYRLGRLDEAQEVFDSIKTIFPQSADMHYYLGEVLLDQRRVDEAIVEFDKAISLDSKIPLPYLNKGIVYFHLKGDKNAAVAETEKAIQVDPRCDLAFVNLAQMHIHNGKMVDAIAAYEKAVTLARTLPDAENSIMGLEAAKAQMVAIERMGQK